MKKLLLFSILFALSVTLFAQTNTWTGAGTNTNWNTVDNWSLNAVPTATNDVVIPTGKTVDLNVAGTTKSIVVKGNSTFNVFNNLSFTNASSFATNVTVNWSSGGLLGGGTLTNNGTVNQSTNNNYSLTELTIFNNTGIFNITGTGDFYINNGIFNNSGVIDMQADEGIITYSGSGSHILNNSGLIKRTTTEGNTRIQCLLNNNNGTIQVESGNLIFDSLDKNLTDGIYNVANGSILQWSSSIIVAGTLTGLLNGDIDWRSLVIVPNTTTANFDFTGSSGVSWTSGGVNGGGTLVNKSLIFTPTNNNRSINESSTLSNEGIYNITGTGDLYIIDGIFNNQAAGVLDMQVNEGIITWSGSGSHLLNNSGLIKRTTTLGDTRIQCLLNNNGGIISVESGSLIFDSLDKNLTDGIYNVSSGSSLQWNSNTILAGTLTGDLDGDIIWTNLVTVPDTTTATFDFTGDSGVNWTSGGLTGGGTLVNKGLVFTPTNNNRSILEVSTLSNEGNYNITGTGDLYISDGIFDNQDTGVIDMQVEEGNILYTGGGSRILNNSGLIKRTTTTGDARIQTFLNNNDGTISVESGSLIFDSLEKNLTDGLYNVSNGSILKWSTNIIVAGTLSGILEGKIDWTDLVTAPNATTANFDFTGNSGVSWTSGGLTGGGTLVNKSLIFTPTNNNRSILDVSTLSNEGTYNITGTGDLYIIDGVFNNQDTGIIDMQVDEGIITYSGTGSHVLNNSGLIKRTTTIGNTRIQSILNNNNGIISVESGNLILDNLDKNLTDGTYNVVNGSILQWTSHIIVAGTLTGLLDGDIDWRDLVIIPDTTTATFNFTGNSGVSWTSGGVNGGGTLVNKSLIFTPTNNNRSINEGSTLSNEGTYNITGTGDLYIVDGILNNQVTGVVDLQVNEGNITYSGAGSHVLNNSGLIQRTTTSGNARIQTALNNSGIIAAQLGTIIFSEYLPFINEEEGTVKGVATVTIANTANYTNEGTFAPGGAPGILTVLGNFKSSSTSVLDVELDGLVQGTEYDLLAITGTNVIFEGNVNVDLGFDANVGDSFTIATVSGVIATKNLVSPVYADFGCKHYTFNITYPNDKAVLLTISAKEDIVPPEVITQDITVQLDDSGNASITTEQIDNGSIDNCTGHEALVFTLDKTDFSCADLGENTVTLTVKDEAVNSASATVTVTVVDSINPTVTCGGNSTVDSNGNYTLPNYTTNGVASVTDNCSATLAQTPAPGTSLADGVHVISFVATDGSGNAANCSFNLTVNDLSLGVNDFELTDDSIQLYPNPVINTLTIKNTKQLELHHAQIMDVTGKTISTINIKDMGLTKEISLENYASGMYFVKISGLNGALTKRIIKE